MEAREISTIVRGLPPGRKESLRETIQVETARQKFLGSKILSESTLRYTLDLLDGRNPAPLRHRNPEHRNGPVIVIQAGWR